MPQAGLGMAGRAPTVEEAVSGAASDEPRGLAKRSLVNRGDFVLETVECHCGATGWSPPETAVGYAIVFVRRGCFHRRLNGTESFVDPTVVYFERPEDEQQIAHPAGGDSCTVLYLSEAILSAIWGGEPGLPAEPLASDAVTDLRQRLLLATVTPEDIGDVTEVVVDLAAEVLRRSAPKRVASGRPATASARRRIVAEAREALLENPRTGVIDLARRVAVSPHHLSRVFKSETGVTISRYRNRLRVRLALERLAEGDLCLARLAADIGFADQAHLARVVRRELGATPSRLRERLAPTATIRTSRPSQPARTTPVAQPASPTQTRLRQSRTEPA
jgi:AraC-like DNA-binding protein